MKMMKPLLSAVALLLLLFTSGTLQVSVRLVNGPSRREGRLEVYYSNWWNTGWGTVCSDYFDDRDARVVCYMLRYGYVGKYIGYRYGAGSGYIWLDDLRCYGTETSIADCGGRAWGYHNCRHWQDVSVSCNIQTRLVGGPSAREGRLEVRYTGTWGTVSVYSFTDASARVVCHTLGYGDGWFIGHRHGAGSGPMWLSYVQCGGKEKSIDDCYRSSWNRYRGTPVVSVSCITKVKLTGSFNPREGRLEVYDGRTWRTACDDHFDDRAAAVVCYMLGYRRGGQFIGNRCGRYGAISGRIWLGNIQCSGTETSIAFCQHDNWSRRNYCGHNKDLSVSCVIEELRLVGDSGSKGRLELFHNDIWGTVCDHRFTDTAARVVCYSLGYGRTGGIIGDYYGASHGRIWLNNVRCSGLESYITDCPHNDWGRHNCSHSDDVSISCIADSTEAVALVGGASLWSGRLEVFHANQWGTVCDDGFTDAAARVVCYSLGFGHIGKKVDINLHGFGGGLIWLNNIDCNGTEQYISECSHGDWGTHNCSHDQDIAISCTDDKSVTPVRLVGGGSESKGRLEVLHNGVWGTVCEDYFTATTAHVICKMLGLVTGSKIDNHDYTTSLGPIWLDDVRCIGTETDIVQCSHNGWGIHNCQHRQDVAVSCTRTEFDVRLNGGRDPREGRLELFYNGVWGSVCEDGFNDEAARVVCNTLGFRHNGRMTGNSYGSEAHGQTWVTSYQCNGREGSINECVNGGLNNTLCSSGAQSVSCLAENAVALMGGGSPREGRLEVYHNGIWGTVCDDGFTDVAARVVCFSLGFGYVGQEMDIDIYGIGTGAIWLDDIHCEGKETHIGECSHRGWNVSDCEHHQDVAVLCTGESPTTSTLRSNNSTHIDSSSRHDPYILAAIIAASVVGGLIICIVFLITGIAVYKRLRFLVHSRQNPQQERTEVDMIPISATAVNSTNNNDAFDDAARYENLTNFVDNNIYSCLT